MTAEEIAAQKPTQPEEPPTAEAAKDGYSQLDRGQLDRLAIPEYQPDQYESPVDSSMLDVSSFTMSHPSTPLSANTQSTFQTHSDYMQPKEALHHVPHPHAHARARNLNFNNILYGTQDRQYPPQDGGPVQSA